MSTDGRVMFSDPELLAVVEQKRLRGKKELVCLATDGSLLVAGSAEHISILDHRCATVGSARCCPTRHPKCFEPSLL
jgi:hypothetical protein